jgi:hypothetical protein
MSIVLCIPLLYVIQLLFESNWIRRKIKFVLEIIAISLAAMYMVFLPDSQLLTYHYSQFWLYLSISILLCFVCLKDCIKDDDLFWHFHINLFSRLTITALYTLVILGGSRAAFGAIDALFKTKLIIHQEIRIVLLTLWVFLPLFFLTGVPKLTNKENILNYKPLWIKNISIYILIPLTTIYLAILYAYTGKIALQWKLPDGWLSYLVISFAAFGIISLLSVFPFQKDENSKWTYWFSRLFYFLQFPLLLILGIAIYQRVMDYGITFRRFYVLLLAVWLLFITVFMVVRKNRNMIAIPFSLLIFAILSSFGPWSAFNVSFLNQKARLDTILKENGLIVNGKLSNSKENVSAKTKGDICSITRYLFEYGKLNVYSGISSQKDSLTPKVFVEQLGFEYTTRWGIGCENKEWFNYSFGNIDNTTFAVQSDSLDAFIKMKIHDGNKPDNFTSNVAGFHVVYNQEKKSFEFWTSNDSTSVSLKNVIDKFSTETGKMQVGQYIHQTSKFKITCLFNNLSGNKSPEGLEINTISVDFLIKSKN